MEAITIHASEIKPIMHAIADENSRYALKDVRGSVSANGVYVTATNGRIAAVRFLAGAEIPADARGKCLIRGDAINAMKDKKNGSTMAVNGSWEITHPDGSKCNAKRPDDAAFPPIADVVPQCTPDQVGACIGFSREVLVDALNAIDTGSPETKGILFIIPKDPRKPALLVSAVGAAVVMPMTVVDSNEISKNPDGWWHRLRDQARAWFNAAEYPTKEAK